LTRLYASQTSFLEIQNGFASLIGLLPSLVGCKRQANHILGSGEFVC
jgi:hypothetical protein